MKNMKYLRTWLVVALVVTIIGSLTGGTVAWFTDSVESTGNKIESGTLDVKLYAVDKKEYDEASATAAGFVWADGHEIKNDSPALFDYKLWEPGYTSLKYVKIENAGNLAFKYTLNVKPAMREGLFLDEKATMLAKVIDVYVVPVGTYNTFAEVQAAAVKGPYTLYELAMASLTDNDGAVHGVMTAEDEAIEYAIALHMQETAGNEYQGLSISDGFVIELRATQAVHEYDSFGNDYDVLAYNDLPSAFVLGLTDEQLASYTITDENDEAINLEAGYLFATTDPSADKSSYKLWHADFVVSFDKPVAADTIGLAGQYNEWNDAWVTVPLNAANIAVLAENDLIPTGSTQIPADTEIRLLKNGAKMIMEGFDKEIYKNYGELCDGVVQFLCGVYQIGDGASGTTMTVKMNLYEAGDNPDTAGLENNWETGKYITTGTFSYTFE